jgi:hypothetical protein
MMAAVPDGASPARVEGRVRLGNSEEATVRERGRVPARPEPGGLLRAGGGSLRGYLCARPWHSYTTFPYKFYTRLIALIDR